MDDGESLPLHRLSRHRPRDQESGARLTYDYHEPGDWPAALALLAQRGDEAAVRVRNQATLGGSVAHADPASDAPVMLAALAAQVVVLRQGGDRHRVPIEELLVDTFTTSLAPTELIQALEVPGR